MSMTTPETCSDTTGCVARGGKVTAGITLSPDGGPVTSVRASCGQRSEVASTRYGRGGFESWRTRVNDRDRT